MVIGDLNAKMGADNRNWEVPMGTHGDGVINENGEMFCDFCASNGLLSGERSSHTKNCISLHGDPLTGSLRTIYLPTLTPWVPVSPAAG